MAGLGDSSVRLHDQGPLAADDVRFLMDSIAPIVDARVADGAPHGRISPAAVRVEDGVPRLVDDGDTDSGGDGTGSAAEDPADERAAIYAAPEVRAGGDATAHSEVYSLAGTTYTLLTGHPPNPYGFATVRRDRPDLGPEVDGVLLQATARTPALRFASATEFAEALAQAIDQPVPLSSIPVRTSAPVTSMRLATPAAPASSVPASVVDVAGPEPAGERTDSPTATAVRATATRNDGRRFEIPEAALPIIFLLLVILAAAGFMALFLGSF